MTTQPPLITPSRLLLTAVSLSSIISPYLADYNPTHVFNPNWPPHARFHNGQTMSMGCVLGLLTLYFTWRPTLSAIHYTPSALRDTMFSAALVNSVYWITGLSGGLYPGAKFLDPEFVGTGYDTRIMGLPGQGVVFAGHLVVGWVGYWGECVRLRGLK